MNNACSDLDLANGLGSSNTLIRRFLQERS